MQPDRVIFSKKHFDWLIDWVTDSYNSVAAHHVLRRTYTDRDDVMPTL